MTTFFKKFKKPYFGANLGNFSSNFEKYGFSWKKELCQFLNIPIICDGTKNLKKLTTSS